MGDDNAGPSSEPSQIINQFKEICDVDTTIAKDFLKESGWDLETAIHQYFHNDDPEAIENRDNEGQELRHRQQAQANSSGALSSLPNGLAHASQNQSVNNTHAGSSGAVNRVPSREVSTGWLGWLSSIVANALQFCCSSVTNVVLFFYVLLFNPPINRPRRIRIERPIASPDSLRRQHENRELMRQQEEEYARALALDKAKRNERMLAEIQRKEEEQRMKEEEMKQQHAEDQKKIRLMMLASTLPMEPAEDETDVIFIRIRLPTGEHKIRRFYMQESLQWLITYVESIGYDMEDYHIWTSDVPKRSCQIRCIMRKFAAIAAASGASFLVGSLIGPQLNDLLPKINSPLLQHAQAASALAVANPTDVLTNLTNKPPNEVKVDDEFWKKPSRASEIMKFGYPGFDNLRTFEDFVLSYDRRTRTAHWVIEHLSPDRMTYDASVDRSKSEFKPDNSIHPYFRSQNSDYFRSGYDRGHLAAAGNHRRSQRSIDETFYLTNMSPQVGKGFNRDKWNDLEKYIRKLAKKHSNIYVCTGPLYLPCQEADGNFYVKYKLIGANRVAVPTHFFKVALIETGRDKYEMEAYMMPNQFIPDEKPISDFLVPLESIERAAGFLIFEHANDKIVKLNGQSTGRKLLNFF